jgi:hypothetical protein
MTETQASLMTEAQLQAAVEGLLRFYGWRYFHAPDNRPVQARSGRRYVQRVTPGFPDVIALRNLPGYGPELLVAELKKQGGRYGDGQQEWLELFDEFGVAVALVSRAVPAGAAELIGAAPAVAVRTWRPEDLLNSTIDRTLCGPEGVNVMVGEIGA